MKEARPSFQASLDLTSATPRYSLSVWTGEPERPVPSNGAGPASEVGRSTRRPVFNVGIRAADNRAIYTYTVAKDVSCSAPNVRGDWSLLALPGATSGNGSYKGFTQTFQRTLSYILYGDMAKLTVEELLDYRLIMAGEDQRDIAKMWVGNLLGSITSYPGTVCREENEDPAKLRSYLEETGVSARPYRYPPTLAGYLVDKNNHLVCFVMYGFEAG